jgi:hypothetical protein
MGGIWTEARRLAQAEKMRRRWSDPAFIAKVRASRRTLRRGHPEYAGEEWDGEPAHRNGPVIVIKPRKRAASR